MGKPESGSSKPEKELESFLKDALKKAGGLNRKYKLSEQLGLEADTDQQLVSFYLLRGWNKRATYSWRSFLRSPVFIKIGHLPGVQTFLNYTSRRSALWEERLSYIETVTDEFEAEHYSDNQGLLNQRAHTIGRAMNMLLFDFFQATPNPIRFNPADELLQSWGQEWKPQLIQGSTPPNNGS